MIPTGAKFWYALCGLALAAAAVYFVAAGGEKYGTFVLVFAGIAAAVLGITATVLYDGDVLPAEGETVREAPRVEALPAVWPVLGAVAVVVALVGLAAGNALLWIGVAIGVVTLVEWMVQSWAERSTPDPLANLDLRNRIMFPIEIPALAVIGVALVVLTVSRMLLALPRLGAVAFAIAIAVVFLGVAALLATRPRVGSSVLSGALALGVVLLVVGGIVGGVVGEREFEHHGDDHDAELEGEDDMVPPDDAEISSRGEREIEGNIDEERLPDRNAPDADDVEDPDTDDVEADPEGLGGDETEDDVADVPTS